ncbi:ParB N-terminal domain-containing protein [Clostridium sp. CX1]|uniref:ParB/RepB/Spo0J family partition protein n=1 Tax=Clostridium sp. CX1 TaxID=2978346 RepID=UPI0021C0E846|nr:ParB N-terminal domain-containing protein [Clostridium sp. CX1]MCT8974988.1 ParB N-terminal domain-containing protein [Clostridium sp. CX1]
MIITDLPINKIKIDVRLWEVDQEHITPIVDSIKQVGLINPITVLQDNGEYTLISGEHRLRAYMELKKETIPAHVFQREYDDIEKDKARCILMEVDENLVRRSSDRFEESYMLYQRKQAYEKLYTESTQINKVSTKDKNGNESVIPEQGQPEVPKSFIQDTVEKTGIKRKSISRRIKIAERMNEEDGRRADSLNVPILTLEDLTVGEPESKANENEEVVKDVSKIKDAVKIHIDTMEEITPYFLSERETEQTSAERRNGFFNASYKKFKKEIEAVEKKYQKNKPLEFANGLREKILNEYLPEYLNPDTGEVIGEEPQCTYEKTDNILICDSVYAAKFPEVCNRFMTIKINDEADFEMTNRIVNTFGQDIKIAIICLDANIFSNYINYKNN